MLSFAMCLRYSFDSAQDAELLEGAINDVLSSGYRTPDIMGPGMTQVTTTAMADQVLKALDRRAA